jgi:replicative DNA helicase
VICIDYIGYIKPESGKTITEQVANIAKGLKELAKKLNIRVMVLSQLNREGGTDGTTPVSVHHFKDSGAIEESADIAIGMWRSASDKNRVHCSILKNREGELDIKFDFIKYATYMQEADLLEEVEEKPTNRSRFTIKN